MPRFRLHHAVLTAVALLLACTTATPPTTTSTSPTTPAAVKAAPAPTTQHAGAMEQGPDGEWLAWSLALGRGGVAVDEPAAIALFEKGCRGGNADACAGAARLRARPRRTTADVAAGVVLAHDACTAGAWMGCATLAELAQAGALGVDRSWLSMTPTPSTSTLASECAAGFAIACRAWGLADASQNTRARARGCDLGDADACAALAPADAAGAKACERGRAGACSALKASSAREFACAFGDEKTCDDVKAAGGRTLEIASWAKGPLDVARALCDQDSLEACTDTGLALLDGEGVSSWPEAAAALLTKSCDRNDARGCAGLALVLDANPALPTDTGVVASSSSACQLGVAQACCLWERHAQSSSTRAKARALGKDCTEYLSRYFSLRDLRVHRFAAQAPSAEFIKGSMIEGEFVPNGDVEGAPPSTTSTPPVGERGYLELAHATFMRAQEARAPRPPYIEGVMTPADGFVATSRRVHR